MSNRNERHEKYFQFTDLVEGNKKIVAQNIRKLLDELNDLLIEQPEKSAGVRKLLEAQDCFIRACEEMQ